MAKKQSWLGSMMSKYGPMFQMGSEYGQMFWLGVRHLTWFVVTTGIMVMLPLLLEMKRESSIEELEALQISDAIDKGATPQDLANAGVTAAIDPKVLKSSSS
mmetsp:Transcript_28630/g.48341  ORF Transcript_28630/g.48341 Transcript_28630/m.48341 type:complete len:102 (+) Transcript_28630:106-411(+)|eukprot:CAMPEP_0114419296 /NCGR_PEP_ID=MMETSP0103-20121206/3949_1 /TAXON_ID=37642 ORGANISM="Paraphysomonas imperforata, Strain PA2" /NCGR_SAMPLE_ID=MMETSP0103 /ASSEMBLY_ACC=CAM_ASM_000201 /LENGTH=101 /DNA_ID=CAMNT_0001587701 /DNA_START=101 /DNA_END=406 /DNA_ORIENTATION=+